MTVLEGAGGQGEGSERCICGRLFGSGTPSVAPSSKRWSETSTAWSSNAAAPRRPPPTRSSPRAASPGAIPTRIRRIESPFLCSPSAVSFSSSSLDASAVEVGNPFSYRHSSSFPCFYPSRSRFLSLFQKSNFEFKDL